MIVKKSKFYYGLIVWFNMVKFRLIFGMYIEIFFIIFVIIYNIKLKGMRVFFKFLWLMFVLNNLFGNMVINVFFIIKKESRYK